MARELNRRSFVVGSAGAAAGFALAVASPFQSAGADEANPEINCWVVVAPDDVVTIRIAHCEMGQGALTGLAMLVAEELECDWANVRAEFVSAQQNMRRDWIWGDMSTGSSRSIASSHLYLRQAGSAARQMLVAAAAARWAVSSSECVAEKSVITHKPTGRSLTFGAVAEEAAKFPPPGEITLKDPSQWKLLGTPQRRLDLLDKVTAQPIYAIDVRLPGMLYAAITHCPVFGGAPQAVDESAIAHMKGVHSIVRLPDAVAVVADSWWRAKRALDALPIQWSAHDNGRVSSASIAELVRAALDAEKSQIGRADGDIAAALQRTVRRIEADYEVPFLAHATMEPQTCTARIENGLVEVWTPTQGATTALATAAGASGVPSENIVVHGTMLGGGFGRRGPIQEYVRQAVLIAKEVDAPVKLVWSREQDIQHDLYRPYGMARLIGGLDADGLPIAWKIRLAGSSVVQGVVPGLGMNFIDRSFLSGLVDEMVYDVPNYLVDYVVQPSPVPIGIWRAINYTQNAFYRECFVDEMAQAAGVDPYHFRRRLLHSSPKNLAILDEAAQGAGWGTPLPPGAHRGIAVSVKDGEVHVHRVFSAIDPGYVVNPLSDQMQTEGAVIYALTAALNGEITIKNGAVEQSNFHDYQMLRLAEAPLVETAIVPSGGFWGGVGEPPVPPLAPAVCNAIFAATGKRIRSLPIKNHDLG